MAHFPFSVVGFDLDGTLFDTHEDLGHAVNHALDRAGRPAIPLAETRDLIGGGSRLMLERAMARTGGVAADLFEPLYADLLTHYEAHIADHTRLFAGGEEMLDALAERGVAIALVTNKLERLARRLVEVLGLTERFYTIIGGDTLGPGRGKPKPDLLLEMIARGPGGRAAYVGDTTYDTGAARAAGIPCVAVSFGFCDVPPHELGADAVIDSFAELVPVLERL
jgi:phosphoglycolate phosphatase